MSRVPRIAVVGGGIGGLAAAWELHQAGAAVTVFEAGPRLGGKIETGPLAGMAVDAGPDAFLARVPHATDLCREVGLGDDLVAPATRHAWLWHNGSLRRFPEGLMLGVPTDLVAIARSGLLSADALAALRADEARTEPASSATGGSGGSRDETIGALVRRRLGAEVLDTLVDPLLAGIFAGDTDQLSVAAAAPQLAAAAAAGPSLVRAARAQVAAGAGRADQPVFLTVRGGLSRLVDALAAPLDVRLDSAVTTLRRTPAGFTVGTAGSLLDVDGVVLAVPGPLAGPMLAPLSPLASTLSDLDYASVTLVSFGFAPGRIGTPLEGSGFLVPRRAGLTMTACSWASSKFAHYGTDGWSRLRVSAGRWGDDRQLRLDDGALVAALTRDLATTMGVTAAPDEVRVSRWPRSLPQYRVGHLDRVAALEADLADSPLVLAGATLRGVGLPACIDGARRAALTLLARLG